MEPIIVIPSSGRAKRQQTLACLHRTGITESYKVFVAVYENEIDKYTRAGYKGKRIKGYKVAAVPETYRGIARKREWILMVLARKHGAQHVIMLDDDLSFCHRPDLNKEDMPYINSDSYEMHHLIEDMLLHLERGYLHVGLISRQANRKLGVKCQIPGRMMNAYAYDAPRLQELVKAKHVQFGRVPVMEDFDLSLQLLKRGFASRVSCQFAWTTTSNLPGGCSEWRTPQLQEKAAKQLARNHPGFVTVVTKQAKTWKGFTERYDVRVQWKKALEWGKLNAKLPKYRKAA